MAARRTLEKPTTPCTILTGHNRSSAFSQTKEAGVGWRTDQHYENLREEEYRRWLESRSWKEWARWRLAQAFRLAIFAAVAVTAILIALRSE